MVLGARRGELIESAARAIRDAGGDALAVPFYVTDESRVHRSGGQLFAICSLRLRFRWRCGISHAILATATISILAALPFAIRSQCSAAIVNV